MARAVIPNEGEIRIGQRILAAGDALEVILYESDVTPTEDTVAADLVECSFPGYAPIPYEPGDPFTEGEFHRARFPEYNPTFPGPSSGDPVTVYGWAIIDRTGTPAAIMVKRFTGGPRLLAEEADEINLAIRWDLFDNSGM